MTDAFESLIEMKGSAVKMPNDPVLQAMGIPKKMIDDMTDTSKEFIVNVVIDSEREIDD